MSAKDDGMVVALLVPMNGEPCEYYCRDCRQLRFWARGGRPDACTNCGSENIEVDRVNSPRLTELRFGAATK